MIAGITQVKIGGRIGTIIMCHADGNINVIMHDNQEVKLNVTPGEYAALELPALHPGIWTRILNLILFWRR